MCNALDNPCAADGTYCRPDYVPPGLRKDVMSCWAIDFKNYVEGTLTVVETYSYSTADMLLYDQGLKPGTKTA